MTDTTANRYITETETQRFLFFGNFSTIFFARATMLRANAGINRVHCSHLLLRTLISAACVVSADGIGGSTPPSDCHSLPICECCKWGWNVVSGVGQVATVHATRHALFLTKFLSKNLQHLQD